MKIFARYVQLIQLITIVCHHLYLGAFVDDDWGLSFVVPGLIIMGNGVLLWLFMVPRPEGKINDLFVLFIELNKRFNWLII